MTASANCISISLMKDSDSDQQAQLPEDVSYEVLHALKRQGYPTTNQRRTVVDAILRHSTHFTAEDLRGALERDGLRVGRATVFRTLELLNRLGYVSRVPEGERWAYTVCKPGHHHHLTCSTCGQVLHLPGCPASAFLHELESQTGYFIEQHHLDVSGICPACQQK